MLVILRNSYRAAGYFFCHYSLRLGMMWSGVEPEEGKINVTYLQEMKVCIVCVVLFCCCVVNYIHNSE